jgi:2-methylcitrate dehydratase PrpD
MSEETGFLASLGAWAARMPPLPEAAEREARLALVDTLACMIAGAGEQQTTCTRTALETAAVSGPSRSVVADMRLPETTAALLNGIAAHALDFDDYEIPGSTHPSAPILGALVAMAEARPVTIGQVTRAYAAGYEVICRFGEALGYGHYQRGWHATATLGPIGAAAAAARLAWLGAPGIAAAMSLATSMAAGLKLQFGTDAKALHAGLAARAGVEAAALAGAGVTAAPGVLDGPHGFLALYGAPGSRGFDALAARIGQPLALVQYPILRKPWPSCAYTHRAIEAATTLAARPGFDATAVVEAELRIPEPFLRVAGFTDPQTPNEARFSARYCVAAALADGAVTPDSFTPAAIARADVRLLMGRVRLAPYPLAPGLGDMSPKAPDRLRLTLTDAAEWTQTVAEVAGGPARPMDREAVVAKFTACGGAIEDAEALLDTASTARFQWSALATARQ